MLPNQKIELFKIRKFGEKMNATVEFVRQNLKPIFKIFLFVFFPIAAVEGVLISQFFEFIFANMSDPQQMSTFSNQFVTSMGMGYFGFIIISVIASILAVGISYGVFKHYQDHSPQTLAPRQALDLGLRFFWKFLGITVVIILSVSLIPSLLFVFGALSQSPFVLFLAFVFFIFPGIYLATTMSLSYPAVVFENASIFDALARSFKLIKEKFWSTFGLLFVTYIAQSFVASVFAIPFYVFYFIIIFTMAQSGTPGFSDPSLGFKIGFTISFAILIFGNFITMIIPLSALGFQYGNLVEMKESPGLIREIEQLGQEKEDQE